MNPVEKTGTSFHVPPLTADQQRNTADFRRRLVCLVIPASPSPLHASATAVPTRPPPSRARRAEPPRDRQRPTARSGQTAQVNHIGSKNSAVLHAAARRSEERRVGKECRSRRAQEQQQERRQ